MSTVTGVSANSLTSAEGRAGQDISNMEFLNLLIAEVQNQNPLEPMKNNELLAQMSSIKALEATNSLTEELSRMAAQTRLGAASSMIGRMVSGGTAAGVETAGMVDGVLVEGDSVTLVVDGTEVPLDNVTAIAPALSDVEGENGDGA